MFASNAVSEVDSETVKLAERHRHESQPHDVLRWIFLPKGISSKAPVGLHRCQVDDKIYFIHWRIVIQRTVQADKKRRERTCRRLHNYSISLHVKAWFRPSSKPSAPLGDLEFVLKMYECKAQNKMMADVLMKKLLGHLWHLSEELMPIALFDEALQTKRKKLMVGDLQRQGANNNC